MPGSYGIGKAVGHFPSIYSLCAATRPESHMAMRVGVRPDLFSKFDTVYENRQEVADRVCGGCGPNPAG